MIVVIIQVAGHEKLHVLEKGEKKKEREKKSNQDMNYTVCFSRISFDNDFADVAFLKNG